MEHTVSQGRSSAVAVQARPALIRRRVVEQAFYLFVAIFVGIIVITPLAWMVSMSFKPVGEAFNPNLLPVHPTFENYRTLFFTPNAPILRWLMNSAINCTVAGLMLVAICVPAAYAYARMDFPGRNLIFAILMATFLIPSVVFLVPNFLIVHYLGIMDTYWAIILPGLGGAFGVFFLRQFFLSLPGELEEAMLIDGANRLRILWSLIVPLSKGACATLFVLHFLGTWNEYVWANLVLNSVDMKTLPIGLADFTGTYVAVNPSLVMAGATIGTIPVAIIFFFLQRFIVESVASAALKG